MNRRRRRNPSQRIGGSGRREWREAWPRQGARTRGSLPQRAARGARPSTAVRRFELRWGGPVRVAHLSCPSESPIRVAHPSRPSESPIRVAHPSRSFHSRHDGSNALNAARHAITPANVPGEHGPPLRPSAHVLRAPGDVAGERQLASCASIVRISLPWAIAAARPRLHHAMKSGQEVLMDPWIFARKARFSRGCALAQDHHTKKACIGKHCMTKQRPWTLQADLNMVEQFLLTHRSVHLAQWAVGGAAPSPGQLPGWRCCGWLRHEFLRVSVTVAATSATLQRSAHCLQPGHRRRPFRRRRSCARQVQGRLSELQGEHPAHLVRL